MPSRSVVSTRRSVRSSQSKCGSVSTQSGRGVAAVSLGKPRVAPPRSSSTVILNRQVTIVDLGLASPRVATDSGPVVGSLVSGHRPQLLPSSLRCALRLRGGASSSTSSSDGEAVGSGVGDDRASLDGGRVGTTRVVSAGVLAREEGDRSWAVNHMMEQDRVFRNILDSVHDHQHRQDAQPSVVEHVHLWADRVFSPIHCYPRPEVAETRLPIPPS